MDKIEEFAKQFDLDKHAVKSLTSFILNKVSVLKERGMLHAIQDQDVFAAFVKKSVEEWHKSSEEFFNRMLNPQTEKDFKDLEYLKEEVYKHCKNKAESQIQ